MTDIIMSPIGHVYSTRKEVTDDNWDTEDVYIELDSSRFSGEALAGLTDFSHAEVLFFMDQVDPAKVEMTARHPRGNKNWPSVGIFAQRGKNRPNQIGITICRVLKVDGIKVHLQGLDAVHGTPVLDIKPWVTEFGPRGNTVQPSWITELMKGYW
jgi:tRNA-Thr(GGU) m(6)t(6)A37 methyltransferase TsaA